MARAQFKVKEGISIADDNSTGGYPLVPVGTVMAFAGSSAPEGWLLCDGSAVSRITYANLWAALSTTYGAGDNSTTFNIPDAMGRTVVGAGTGSGLTSRTIAAKSGSESVTLTGAQSGIAAHGHGNTISASSGNASVDHSHNANHGHTAGSGTISADHAHAMPRSAISQAGTNRLNVSNSPTDTGLYTYGVSANHTHGITVDANNFNTAGQSATHNHIITVSGSVTDVSSSNASASHENMMPFLVLNYIIKY